MIVDRGNRTEITEGSTYVCASAERSRGFLRREKGETEQRHHGAGWGSRGAAQALLRPLLCFCRVKSERPARPRRGRARRRRRLCLLPRIQVFVLSALGGLQELSPMLSGHIPGGAHGILSLITVVFVLPEGKYHGPGVQSVPVLCSCGCSHPPNPCLLKVGFILGVHLGHYPP